MQHAARRVLFFSRQVFLSLYDFSVKQTGYEKPHQPPFARSLNCHNLQGWPGPLILVRAVIQRVKRARVSVDDNTVGEIGPGLCAFVGISRTDGERNAIALADKIKNLRVFADAQGKMNYSTIDVGGAVLVVSQFTLYGDCARGNRPSFTDAAAPAEAQRLYDCFVERLRASGVAVETGEFQAHMNVTLTHDGPVTLILEV